MTEYVQTYVSLLDEFLCGKVGPGQFERRFLETWQGASDPVATAEREAGDQASRALEELFYAVNSFVEEAGERDPRIDLDLDGLRERAKSAIRVLQG